MISLMVRARHVTREDKRDATCLKTVEAHHERVGCRFSVETSTNIVSKLHKHGVVY